MVTIAGWTAVDDFGTLINPMIVEGQVHGGVAQGVGQALLEGAHLRQRRPAADRLATWTTACRAPTTCRRSRSTRSRRPVPSNPLGIKGCGEAGAIASPPAVINAITDALGHENVAMPATPQAVWRAAQKAVKRAAE